MIELQNISISVTAHEADALARKILLDGITLTIDPGQWVALVGPNGAGKTTLLKVLAGLMRPSAGVVRYTGASGRRPATALLLQEPDNQFVAGSVRDELRLSLPPSSQATDQRTDALRASSVSSTPRVPQESRVSGARLERFDRAIEMFGLGDVLDRNPHRLSGGEKQRLALATVWLAKPRLLLLDEPTSYLDAAGRAQCIEFVGRLSASGVAVVWATPGGDELGEAGTVAYLTEGRLAFTGSLEGFYRLAKQETFDYLPVSVQPAVPLILESPYGSSGGASVAESDPGGRDARSVDGDIVVTMRGLSFTYPDSIRPALDDVSVTLRSGECVGITGVNGSGKSTLLGIMSGILDPSAGTIQRAFGGVVENGEQQVFHLFQNPERLFFAETAFEEVAFGLDSLGTDRHSIRTRVDDALRLAGLAPGEFLHRQPFSLSLGEMRRLAFAIAYALRPKFLLLDEPTSCLDGAGRAILSQLIMRLQADGGTIVVASHDTAALAGVVARWLEL